MYINPFSNSFQSSQLSAVNSGICDVIQHVSLECNCVLSLKFSSYFFSYLFPFCCEKCLQIRENLMAAICRTTQSITSGKVVCFWRPKIQRTFWCRAGKLVMSDASKVSRKFCAYEAREIRIGD